jgi:type IV secretion system protein VirB10
MTDPVSPAADPAPEGATIDPSLEPERGISPVAGRSGGSRRGRWIAIAALGVGCAVFYLASAKTDRPKPAKAPKEPARQVVFYDRASGVADRPTLAAPGPDAPSLLAKGSDPITTGVDQTDPADTAQTHRRADGPSPATAVTSHDALAREMRSSPILAYTQDVATLNPLAGPTSKSADAEMSRGPTQLDQLLQGSTLGRSRARSIGDRNFLILAGAVIPCVLLTALDSATPGYVTCMVPTDVYSDNGAVILLERGTKVLGEYRSSMRQGQNRLFVLWTRAVTPAGVAVTLASPAADALGRAGFDGALDSHFWDRFGGALLLSIIDDGVYAAAGSDRGAQTLRAPSDAASVALQNSVNIAPSLRKAQGAQISILAAQDFDFSGVYGLRSR